MCMCPLKSSVGIENADKAEKCGRSRSDDGAGWVARRQGAVGHGYLALMADGTSYATLEPGMNAVAPGPARVKVAATVVAPPPAAAVMPPPQQQQAMEIECPAGVAAGGLVAITTPDGRQVNVTVPAGIVAGDKFIAQVPAAAPVAIAPAEVHIVHVAEQPPEATAPPPSSPKRVDTAALTGMRGAAALHVAVGHYMSFSEMQLDGMGGAAMPFLSVPRAPIRQPDGLTVTERRALSAQLATLRRHTDSAVVCTRSYLLSGFVMTLGYSKGNKMNTRKFFQNRCARLLPVFYLTNLLPVLLLIISSAPLALIGWRSDALDDASVPVLNAGLTLFAANSWLAPLYGISGVMPINGVTWTITTMGFFYMVFPCSEWTALPS
jgi:hypothetical protein